MTLHIPNPLRCFKCQDYGHHVTKCQGVSICAKCCALDHVDKDCKKVSLDFLCHNCKGNHPSWSRECQVFIKEKRVCAIKVHNDISYFEARKLVMGKKDNSYADAAAPQTFSIATQTVFSLGPLEYISNFPELSGPDAISGVRITPTVRKPVPTKSTPVAVDAETSTATNIASCSKTNDKSKIKSSKAVALASRARLDRAAAASLESASKKFKPASILDTDSDSDMEAEGSIPLDHPDVQQIRQFIETERQIAEKESTAKQDG